MRRGRAAGHRLPSSAGAVALLVLAALASLGSFGLGALLDVVQALDFALP